MLRDEFAGFAANWLIVLRLSEVAQAGVHDDLPEQETGFLGLTHS